VRLHHAAAEVGARIVLLNDSPIQPGTSAHVQLVLERPIAAAVCAQLSRDIKDAVRSLEYIQVSDLTKLLRELN